MRGSAALLLLLASASALTLRWSNDLIDRVDAALTIDQKKNYQSQAEQWKEMIFQRVAEQLENGLNTSAAGAESEQMGPEVATVRIGIMSFSAQDALGIASCMSPYTLKVPQDPRFRESHLQGRDLLLQAIHMNADYEQLYWAALTGYAFMGSEKQTDAPPKKVKVELWVGHPDTWYLTDCTDKRDSNHHYFECVDGKMRVPERRAVTSLSDAAKRHEWLCGNITCVAPRKAEGIASAANGSLAKPEPTLRKVENVWPPHSLLERGAADTDRDEDCDREACQKAGSGSKICKWDPSADVQCQAASASGHWSNKWESGCYETYGGNWYNEESAAERCTWDSRCEGITRQCIVDGVGITRQRKCWYYLGENLQPGAVLHQTCQIHKDVVVSDEGYEEPLAYQVFKRHMGTRSEIMHVTNHPNWHAHDLHALIIFNGISQRRGSETEWIEDHQRFEVEDALVRASKVRENQCHPMILGVVSDGNIKRGNPDRFRAIVKKLISDGIYHVQHDYNPQMCYSIEERVWETQSSTDKRLKDDKIVQRGMLSLITDSACDVAEEGQRKLDAGECGARGLQNTHNNKAKQLKPEFDDMFRIDARAD